LGLVTGKLTEWAMLEPDCISLFNATLCIQIKQKTGNSASTTPPHSRKSRRQDQTTNQTKQKKSKKIKKKEENFNLLSQWLRRL
jgi:hypothetical protein